MPLRVLLASAVVSVAHSLAPPRAGAATIGGLTLVPQEPRGAACLDGSAPGYWVDKGVGVNASSWVLHAQGGGWCWDEQQCAARAKTSIGSSKAWGAETSCCEPNSPRIPMPPHAHTTTTHTLLSSAVLRQTAAATASSARTAQQTRTFARGPTSGSGTATAPASAAG